MVGEWQNMDNVYYRGMTVMKLAIAAHNMTAGAVDVQKMVAPAQGYFDDSIFFEVHEDNEDEEEEKKPKPRAKPTPWTSKPRPISPGMGTTYDNDAFYAKP